MQSERCMEDNLVICVILVNKAVLKPGEDSRDDYGERDLFDNRNKYVDRDRFGSDRYPSARDH
ncbi:hypothetical protein AKJ16_DCAP15482 [Drosera capensis]